MKILCIPDLHAFPTAYDRPLEDGLTTRMVDWLRSAQALADLAIREKVGLAVAPGDFFMTPRPPARAIIEVAHLFKCLESAGIPVVGCAGNHDVPGPGQAGPVDVIARLGSPRWGVTTPQVVTAEANTGEKVQVAVLPWTKPAAILQDADGAGDLIQRTTDALVAIVRMLAAQLDPGLPAILIGHWALSGARLSSGEYLTSGEPAIPVPELAGLPFRAVIMGHIHRPQILADGGGGPVVLHTGAFQRIDFGEEDDRRGAYIVDIETGEAAWHDLPVRRFLTIDLDAADVDWIAPGGNPAAPLSKWSAERNLVADAIVRVRYRATEELARQIDHGALIRVLERLGAHHVAGVYPEIMRSERTRAEGLTEQTSPLQALDRWLSLRGELSDELRAEVRAAAEALMREVA